MAKTSKTTKILSEKLKLNSSNLYTLFEYKPFMAGYIFHFNNIEIALAYSIITIFTHIHAY